MKWPWKPESIETLAPHGAESTIEFADGEFVMPTIFLSLDAYADTHHIMETCGDDEIGWLGTVKKMGAGEYLIDRIFLFEQEVSGGHCQFDQKDVGKFYTDLLAAGPENRAVLNSILFWGHLHPGTFDDASEQDDEQMGLFANGKFFIRGIFTRKGKCKFTFYDYARKITITDCPWKLYVPDCDRRKEIATEIKQKVRKVYTAFNKRERGKKWKWKYFDYEV